MGIRTGNSLGELVEIVLGKLVPREGSSLGDTVCDKLGESDGKALGK